MALRTVPWRRRELLLYAVKERPSLIIDCANAADPHALFPDAEFEELAGVYVLPVEIIYGLRDALLAARQLALQLHARTIILTPYDKLFHYGDARENRDVIEHAGELLQLLGEEFEVVVAVRSIDAIPAAARRPVFEHSALSRGEGVCAGRDDRMQPSRPLSAKDS